MKQSRKVKSYGPEIYQKKKIINLDLSKFYLAVYHDHHKDHRQEN